jgi:uncharacterized protein (TIGR03067 family)
MKHAIQPWIAVIVLMAAMTHTFAQADSSKSQQASAFAPLAGIWLPQKVTSSGAVVSAAKFPFEVHFTEPNRMIFKFVGGTQGKDRVHEVTLDTSKDPAVMDMTRTGRGQTVFAIYKIEDDQLTICSLRGADGQPSSERPKGFESDEVTKSDLLVLKRKAKANE